jgi:hypothetical protein
MEASHTLKAMNAAVTLCGLISLAGCAILVTASFITFHPSIMHTVNLIMLVTFVAWALFTILTIGFSLAVVGLAEDSELPACRAIRRRGLWMSLPQILLFIFFLVAGLLLARDIAQMGSH